ncbi:hypothetical protein CDAR_423671 [Caerostris darwini]|uniref:Uncharacterized protein n=1 Tax=Caerostris darwini TaxID=1538125 RepID=A0AAV4VCP3_9ARAC|nr:hypothetical protein CDAR_423671 [Caerostris darwini]
MSETSVTAPIESGTQNTEKDNHCVVIIVLSFLDHQAKGYFSFETLNCCILFSAIHSGAKTVISPIDIHARATGWASIHTDSTADKMLRLINMGS